MLEGEEVLREKDAAQFLKIKQSTLYRWRRDGSGPRYSSCGKRIRYLKSTLVEWVREREVFSVIQKVEKH